MYEIRSMHITYAVLRGNSRELVAGLDSHEQSTHAGSLDDVTVEIIRRLHNYVAAAKSLVDHTRRIVNSLCSQLPFMHEYEERVQQTFATNPLARFVQDLRNYTLHRDLPIRGASVGRVRGAFGPFIALDTDALASWDRWSSPAARYLTSSERPLLVRHVVDAYDALVADFQEWLEARLRQVFSADIAEEQRLREMVRAASRSVRSRPRG